MRVPVSHRCCLFQVLDTYMFRSFLKARLNRRMDAFAQADLSTQSEEDGYLSPWWGARLGVQTRARRSSVRAERRPVGESHAASRALLRPWSACALFPPWCPPPPVSAVPKPVPTSSPDAVDRASPAPAPAPCCGLFRGVRGLGHRPPPWGARFAGACCAVSAAAVG